MEQYNYMPIGTVVSYAGATTPIGWLLCDGRTIEEHEYPDLYRVLGSGILPDLRGEFGQIIKAFNTTTDTETLPIQMAKALNNKIENNYNDQLDATVDIVGKEFYDYIQNSGEKTAGKIYRDRLQKGIFRCLKTTTSVLNTSEFYEPLSNNDLLGKLQNLTTKKCKTITTIAEGILLNTESWVELFKLSAEDKSTFNFISVDMAYTEQSPMWTTIIIPISRLLYTQNQEFTLHIGDKIAYVHFSLRDDSFMVKLARDKTDPSIRTARGAVYLFS